MKKIIRKDLQKSIIDGIKSYIYTEKLNPGDPLPSQSTMAELFGISRTSIREAIRTMEGQGLVRVINGKGIFVEQIDTSYYEEDKENEYRLKCLIETFYVRKILEGGAIREAVKIATDAELKELSDMLSKVEDKFYKGMEQAEEDLNYHRRILKISGNSLLIRITENIIAHSSGLWMLRDQEAEILNESIPSHRQVTNYMMARDAENALKVHDLYFDKIIAELEGILKTKK